MIRVSNNIEIQMGFQNYYVSFWIYRLLLPYYNRSIYYLLSDRASVDLDFHDVSLLLSATKDLLLGMSDQSYNRAVFLDLTQILFDFFFAQIISPFQLSLRECLLLRFGPIFSIFRQIELWREIEKALSTFSNSFINASQHTFNDLTPSFLHHVSILRGISSFIRSDVILRLKAPATL